MSQPITYIQYTEALALLGLDDLTVSESLVKAKRTAAAKTMHPDLFLHDNEIRRATDELSRINEACDLLLQCLDQGILPRFRDPSTVRDFYWQNADLGTKTRKKSGTSRSSRENELKKQPAWVREEYQHFKEWCAQTEFLTVERMDKEWNRRIAARRFDDDMRKRQEAEAQERLRQALAAEALEAQEAEKRAAAEAFRQQKRAAKQAEAAARKLARKQQMPAGSSTS